MNIVFIIVIGTKKKKQKLCPKERMTICLFVLAHLLGPNKKPNVLGHGMHTFQRE